MQIQVFRGAPALLYRIIKPANSLDINPTKVKRQRGRELSAREDLCVSHSILQLSKVSGGNKGLHKKSIPSDPVSKTFQYFCDASKVLTMKFDAATPSLSLHASFWRFITHEGEAQLCCNVGNLPSLGLILFPQQRHAAAPLHDSSRFTLCPREEKDGERETHV